MQRIIGFTPRNKGQFTDEQTGRLIDFDNVVIHLIDNENSEVVGSSADQLKVKYDDLPGYFDSKKNPDQFYGEDLAGLVGRYVRYRVALKKNKAMITGLILEETLTKNDVSGDTPPKDDAKSKKPGDSAA